MIKTRSIDELAKMVENDDRNKWDIEVPAHTIRMQEDGTLRVGKDFLGVTGHASAQLYSKLSIPVSYAKRCPSELLATHVNHWLDEQEDSTWLIRGKNHYVRAFLSTNYAKLDNAEILRVIRQRMKNENLRIELASVGDDVGFHIRLVMPNSELDLGRLRNGERDKLFGGVHISNSEVGRSSASTEMLIWRLVCTNGMLGITGDYNFRQAHRGRGVMDAFKEKLDFSLNAAPLKTRETLVGLEGAMGTTTNRGEEIVKYYAEEHNLSKVLTEETLLQLQVQRRNDGQVFSKYDLVNAFTASARIAKGDHRYAIEVIAGKLLQEDLEKLEAKSSENNR